MDLNSGVRLAIQVYWTAWYPERGSTRVDAVRASRGTPIYPRDHPL